MPTYRDTIEEMSIVLEKAFAVFAKERDQLDFLVKLHPHAADKITMPSADNIHGATGSLEELMAECDGLITDYSSCVFDFMLMRPEQPYLFFCPDLDCYQATTGVQKNFLTQMAPRLAVTAAELTTLLQPFGNTAPDQMPGKVVKSATHPLLTQDNVPAAFDSAQVRKAWHRYNDGHAVARLLSLVAQLLGD